MRLNIKDSIRWKARRKRIKEKFETGRSRREEKKSKDIRR